MDEPRAARPTINFIDEYCAHYRNLFSDVRSFEAFKHLHVGMLSSIRRKTLPAIAELVRLPNEQSLHPWYVMTEIPEIRYKDVGNLYGCRNWVEYALNQSKNELEWADFRLSRYESIEKWWEILSSAYLLVSLFATPWRD